jgi:hypothetical protein
MRRQRKLKNFSISRRGPDNPKFELPDQGALCLNVRVTPPKADIAKCRGDAQTSNGF